MILSKKQLGFPWETQDPFLFCVHHADAYPKGNDEMGPDKEFLAGRNIGQDFTIKDGFRMYHGRTVPGFPAHPHRGFETVTVVNKGLVDHADSMGAAGRFGNGDVQWMTAGKGVQHSEMFPLLDPKNDNPLELFQIWLNLPASKKFVDPHFSMLWGDKIPWEKTDAYELKIIAGTFNDKHAAEPAPDSWAADPQNEVAIWTVKIKPGKSWKLPAASTGINRTLYFYQGDEIKVGNELIDGPLALELKADEEIEVKGGQEEAFLLLLQGKPINEPVVQYGPFVMNTQAEIQETMMDFQQTQFGGWPWPKHDQVHPRNQGKFAKHANGEIETR